MFLYSLPVITLSISSLEKYTKSKVNAAKITEFLPYLGLDIEDQHDDLITVEYSPNRPDFSSEAGVARSLVGLLGIQTGLEKYNVQKGDKTIIVAKDEIRKIRPYVFSLEAKIRIDEALLKQLIMMQEDLHNGLGRKRSKLAIGLHNGREIKSPIHYFGTGDANYSFIPLGSSRPKTIKEIVTSTEQGQEYSRLLTDGIFPLLVDSNKQVLSMPPIINGEYTRLAPGVQDLFVDVTATDQNAGDTAVAIITTMLADNGAEIRSVRIENDGKSFDSPNLEPRSRRLDLKLINSTLGLELSLNEAKVALEKSRLELTSSDTVSVPRYRDDIIHPVDLAEEVALGYGIMNLTPQEVTSSLFGAFSPRIQKIQSLVEIFVGLGLTEISELSLTSEREVAMVSETTATLNLEDSKSQSYMYLKSELAPALLSYLASNLHEEYPQKLFEQAPIMKQSPKSELQIIEEEHVAVALASQDSNYTRIRSLLDAFSDLVITSDSGLTFEPLRESKGIFMKGRSAEILLKAGKTVETKRHLGTVGEVSPNVLEDFGLKMPVSAFEINLEPLLENL